MVKLITLYSIIACSLILMPALASDFSSASFNDLDPVLLIEGGRSTSTNFQLISGTGQTVIGESIGASFSSRSGFFYYPIVTTPVLSATAGDGQATLTWTSAVGQLGYNVTSYEVGRSTVSGGPYTFTNYGNVLTKTITGLTNGSTYYFVIRVSDNLGNYITTSTEAAAAPVAGPVTPPPSTPPPGGGGGGAPAAPTVSKVNLSGRAYPLSSVTLLKDAQVVASTIAGPDANFQISLANLTAGNYIFSLYSEDSAGRRSNLITFPASVTEGATTNITGIFLGPTIAVDKEQVKKGENIAIFGQSAPKSEIVIIINSDQQFFVKTGADEQGVYLYNFDTSPLEYGSHLTKSKASLNGQISPFSNTVNFEVGAKSVKVPSGKVCQQKADLNNDCRVNLVDFSIAAYWYKRPIGVAFAKIEKDKFNGAVKHIGDEVK